MKKKKVLVTGGNGMLAYDFYRTQAENFDIIRLGKNQCDVTSFESAMQNIAYHEPDVILNCAAYTSVDDAEDIGMKACFDINTFGAKNVAKAAGVFGIDMITLSTNYVFDGKNPNGYDPEDTCNPISAYGMSKYLGEKLVTEENPRAIIIRTGWLLGGNPYGFGHTDGLYKNFVNTIIKLSESTKEIKVVNDQYGVPTSCESVSFAIARVIDSFDEYAGGMLHLMNSSGTGWVTWADFAQEILSVAKIDCRILACKTSEYPTKAKRPMYSVLRNPTDIILPDWKAELMRHIGK